jgi:glycosyltransferase involved in cell wall biosynthesis
MKILAVNWRDPGNPEAGGAEIHLHHILTRAAAAGHRVVQVSHAVQGLPEVQDMDGVEIRRNGFWYSFNLSVKKYCEGLGLDSFDLILEDICKVPVFTPLWSGVPVLAVVPHLFGTTAFREVGAVKAAYVNLLESFIPGVYRGCPFVAISESTRRDLLRRGVPGDAVEVVPCGMDTGIYRPDPGVPVDTGRFLYVGRLRKYKGVQHAIRALSILRERRFDVRLTVLGEGDYAAELKSLSRRLGLEDRVDFEGFVPLERKLYCLRNCCAAVFPSEKEGWGLTVIEANCCGSPVIASRSDGLTDSVRHGETGLLVTHGHPRELADAMERMITEPGLRAGLSKGGLEWGAGFDWDATGSAMLRIMERTVRSRRRASPQENRAARHS